MTTVQTPTRIQVKNILFPTDLSPAGLAASPYAREIAKRFGAKMYALHVVTPAVNPMTEPATWAVLEKASEAEAEKERETILKAFPGIEPEILIEEGGLWTILASTLEKYKIDLIVLGTRGRSGVKKFFLGSTAEEIFRKAPCAVLTVGPASPEEPPRGGEISEIVYATDFSSESTAAATYAFSLAEEFQAHLTLLHVVEDLKPGDLVIAEQLEASSERLLRNLIPPEAELWCEPRVAVERGSVAEKILEVATSRGADLIVLGVHKPKGLPGAATHLPFATAHKVVSQAKCPVLTVRG
jgi:nucleotide-binding universal stress UspA family protein